MKHSILFFLSFLFIINVNAQQDSIVAKKQVYKKINPWVTYPIIGVGLVTNYFGIQFLKSKPGIDPALLTTYGPEDVNAFDRGATRQHTADKAYRDMKISDWLLNGSFVLPLALLADKNIKSDALKVGVILLESSAIMANAYSWGVGHVNRIRPYVFNPQEDPLRRIRRGSFNSFYGGHAAASAMATFFAVKVYHDYNPGSKLTPWLYGVALIPPAAVAYFRYTSGMHFPSDLIVGIAAGAFIGTIVPHLHKAKNNGLSIYPVIGPGNGIGMTYQFK
jgi:membrane-associated phospholipid phosphatase